MKKPLTRVWIDARGETLNPGEHDTAEFIIENLDQEKTRSALLEAVFPLVKEIRLMEDKKNAVSIGYNPSLLTASFIEYLLKQKGLNVENGG